MPDSIENTPWSENGWAAWSVMLPQTGCLIYERDEETLTLYRLGSHAELFG